MIRVIVAILFSVSVLAGLSACGKKGEPQLPKGQSDEFPRPYPIE